VNKYLKDHEKRKFGNGNGNVQKPKDQLHLMVINSINELFFIKRIKYHINRIKPCQYGLCFYYFLLVRNFGGTFCNICTGDEPPLFGDILTITLSYLKLHINLILKIHIPTNRQNVTDANIKKHDPSRGLPEKK
jgi:hypothetical protein